MKKFYLIILLSLTINIQFIEFAQAIAQQLQGCGFLEGVYKFFDLFVHHGDNILSEEQENQATLDAQINARDNRTKDQNDELDDETDNNYDSYNNGTGKYSPTEVLCQLNKDLFHKHISVGFIINVSANSMFSNIGSSIGYIDREAVQFWRGPGSYIKFKTKQYFKSVAQSYVSRSISDHLVTPLLIMSDEKMSEATLKIISPMVNVFTGVCISSCVGIMSGKDKKTIAKEAMYNTVNSALTTGIMTGFNETAIMTALNEFSKKISLMIAGSCGFVLPPSAAASILISTALTVIQRVCVFSYNIIKHYYERLDYCNVSYLKFSNDYSDSNIFIDFKSNNSFFN